MGLDVLNASGAASVRAQGAGPRGPPPACVTKPHCPPAAGSGLDGCNGGGHAGVLFLHASSCCVSSSFESRMDHGSACVISNHLNITRQDGMADQERVGARIAVIRKTRGWTGRELAGRAHVSYSLLAKVESGAAPASPALIGAVARALRVDVPRITGQPYEGQRGQAARLHDTIPAIRRSVDTYDLPDETIVPRPFAELSTDVRRISAWGQSAKYSQIGAELPGLLDELVVAVHAAGDAGRPQLFGLLAEAYSGASAIANVLGYLDLRSQVVERIRWASERCDDPLRLQRVRWQRTASLMAVGAYDQGLSLMANVRSDLGEDTSSMSASALSVYGSAHLRSAVLAARAAKTGGSGYAQEAWAQIDAARPVGERMGTD